MFLFTLCLFGLASSIQEHYDPSAANMLDFDMYDITSGKIISCNESQPRQYEQSIKWDSQQQPPLQPVFIECKDMEPTSKVNQLQPYVVETFPTACHIFYRAIIDSSFWATVSEEMGFYEMTEGLWSTSATACHQERELNFKTPISFKIGPKCATVTQVQKIRRTPTSGYFMETSSVSRDVPYGESFSVENYISLEPSGKDSCSLKVSTAVKFTKSVWGIGGLIEKSVIQSNKDFFNVWVTMARRVVDANNAPNTPPQQNRHQQPLSPVMVQQPQPQQNVHIKSPQILSQPLPPPQQVQPQQQQPQQPQANEETMANYEEIKKLFLQLFRETQNPRTVKLVSRTGQHIANITIHPHYTVGHVVQYLIPQALPDLTVGKYFDMFWLDKRNEHSLFFGKDLDLPILNYLQSSDSLCVCPISNEQLKGRAASSTICFEIVKAGRAIIKN
eukprot:gene6601-7665_t